MLTLILVWTVAAFAIPEMGGNTLVLVGAVAIGLACLVGMATKELR